jgi:quinol monooxygenase YgiN
VHIQIITFKLKGITRSQYEAGCEEGASAFAALPGLISKTWLADERTNTYGGVYLWKDRAALESYLKSDLFRAVATDPNFADVTSRDFAVLEGPSAVTGATRAVAA